MSSAWQRAGWFSAEPLYHFDNFCWWGVVVMDWDVHVPKVIAKLTQREVLWFWGMVALAGPALDPKFAYPKDLAIRHILPFVTGGDPEYDFDIVIADKDNCLLPISEFDWISQDDTRLNNWLLPALSSMHGFHEPVYLKNPNISKKERFISTIDNINMPAPDKVNLLVQLRMSWAAIISQAKIFRWIDKSDEGQCQWVWEELVDKSIYAILEPDLLNPIRPEDCYYSFFAKLDRSGLHPAEKELLLGKMQKKWVRRKQKKKKVQANYQLSPQASSGVSEMADREGLGKSEFMEKLISGAYAKFIETGSGL